jgi:hypothetical protein
VAARIHKGASIDSISGGMCRAPLRWVKLPSRRRKLKSAAARPRGGTPHGRRIAAVQHPCWSRPHAARRPFENRNLHMIAGLSAPGANSPTPGHQGAQRMTTWSWDERSVSYCRARTALWRHRDVLRRTLTAEGVRGLLGEHCSDPAGRAAPQAAPARATGGRTGRWPSSPGSPPAAPATSCRCHRSRPLWWCKATG